MFQREALTELQAGKLRPVYLIYGGEPFLEEELFRAIRTAAVRPETADFNYHLFEPGPDQLQQALSIAQTQPFFAEHRLVVVRNSPIFAARKKPEEEGEEEEAKTSNGEELLLAYLKQPVPSTSLVFITRGSVDGRKKITKAVVATGGAVECKPLRPEDAIMWAEHRAVFYGKKLHDAAARTLVEKVGADLRLIDTELNKLSLYVGEAKAISPADVETAVGGMAETEIYRLTEAVMLKERAKALSLLARVLRQVDHPLQVLAALTNKFRQILVVKALQAQGVSVREGAGMAKMHPYPYEKMLPHVRSYPRSALISAMERLLEADLAIKAGAEPVVTVETLVVELMA